MSLNLELIKSKSSIETVSIAILSFGFSVLCMLLLILGLNTQNFDINLSNLMRYGFIDIFTDKRNFFGMLAWATPLAFSGLAVGIAFQAGLFNIGGQGQMSIGACFAAIWAAAIAPDILPDALVESAFFMVLTTMFAGMLGGGIWGFIPGYLKTKTGAHEVIVTIMMNFIALAYTTYLIGSQTYSPYVDKTSTNANSQTDKMVEASNLDPLYKEASDRFTIAFFIAIIVIIFTHFLIAKSNFGYRLRAVGLNPEAAKAAGINVHTVTVGAMTLSGGLAGLGGALFVMSVSPYRYYIRGEGTLGFDGIAVALIGQNSPIAIGIAAIFFGFLVQSGDNLDFKTDDVPPEIIYVLQGFVILFVAAPILARKLIHNMNVERRLRDWQEGKEKKAMDETGGNLK